jgi:hypothetical protein
MSELDALPADQRAVLQLLLKQGQGYDDIATMLSMDRDAVRARAHGALETLGPESGRRMPEARRAEVSDYLLGQQSRSEREATREHLAGSASSRGWARVVAGALRPLDGDALPEIPDEADRAEPEETAAAPGRREREKERDRDRDREGAGRAVGPPSSRLGGALLLAGLAILIAVVLVLVLRDGDDDKREDRGQRTQQTTAGQQPAPIAQINLGPAQRGSRSVGLAQVFAQQNRRLVIIAAQGLAAGTYALWLFNSPSNAKLLGFVPQQVGRDGRFVTQGELAQDAGNFRELIVTRERVAPNQRQLPSRPGQIVLRGRVQLGQG